LDTGSRADSILQGGGRREPETPIFRPILYDLGGRVDRFYVENKRSALEPGDLSLRQGGLFMVCFFFGKRNIGTFAITPGTIPERWFPIIRWAGHKP